MQENDGPVLAVPSNKDEPVDNVQAEVGLIVADAQEESGLAVEVVSDKEPVPPDKHEEGGPVLNDAQAVPRIRTSLWTMCRKRTA